jgi:hypothetical protein
MLLRPEVSSLYSSQVLPASRDHPFATTLMPASSTDVLVTLWIKTLYRVMIVIFRQKF